MRLRVGVRTDKGLVRELNEDAYASSVDRGLFIVCDGMGGAPAGEVASQMAVDHIVAHLHNDAPAVAVADTLGYLPCTARLADAVRRSNQFIYGQAQSDPRQQGMGTTAVGAWISEHVASVAHVGDSRAYLWRHDLLEPLTDDHSIMNALIRVLGREPDVDVDVSEVPIQRGDYLLLCSDGLTRMVSDLTIAQAIVRLRTPQSICDHLVAVANANGGMDNITVVVVEVVDSWWHRAWSRVRRARGAWSAETHSAV